MYPFVRLSSQSQETRLAAEDKVTRIVILGGGFSGVYTARNLSRLILSASLSATRGGSEQLSAEKIRVEIISDTNYFVFQPLLPEVASGIINATDAVTSLRLLLPRVKVRMAEVRRVDFQNNIIEVVQGSKRVPITISYDHLVVALGQKTDLSALPGLAAHSHTLRNIADAHGLRNQVIQCLEHADVTKNQELKHRLLTFVVAGGGFSGVETMGEVMDLVNRARKHYPSIKQQDIRMILIQRGDRVLPELSPELADYAHKKLQQRGLDIRTNCSMVSATATAVMLNNGEKIETSTIVTTVGNGPSELVKSFGFYLERGKIVTNRELQVIGYKNVWAIGDVALVSSQAETHPGATPSFAPPTAQFAVQEAKCLAGNIIATLLNNKRKPFHYRPKGALASIGQYQGVAELFGIRFSGLLAWLMWRSVYLGMLPGYSTRLRVALNWAFDYVLPRSIVQISNQNTRAVRYMHYLPGDTVFLPGQIIDGFYTVVSGSLESRVYSAATGKDFVRKIGPGDHWGERSLFADTVTMGSLIATEASQVLIINRSDFPHICKAIPALDNYFQTIPDHVYPHSLRHIRPKQEAKICQL